jgi:type I restriction enzyme S subunit
MSKEFDSSPDWANAKLGDLVHIATGKLDANAAVEGGRYPFFTCAESVSRIDTWAFDKDAILLAGNGSFSVKRYSGKFNAYQRTYVIESAGIDTRFLYWLIRGNIRKITQSERGSTIPYIRKGDITGIDVDLPALAEQKVIADKLDTLLAQVENTKARLERIPQILKRFRQSVLAAAVSGRFNEGDGCAWESIRLIDVVQEKPRNGSSPKGVHYETPYRNLTLSATTSGRFLNGCFKYVELDVDKDSHLWVKDGDILIQRANTHEYVGISALYRGPDNVYVYPDLMMKCRANERVMPEFLHLTLLSEPVRKYLRENATGTSGNMPKINQKTVCNTSIRLPALSTQSEIVRRVDQLFAHADRIERQVENALSRVNNLTQSILAKAFRGELTEQWRLENSELVSGENSAEALLDGIKAEWAATKPRKKTRKAGGSG